MVLEFAVNAFKSFLNSVEFSIGLKPFSCATVTSIVKRKKNDKEYRFIHKL